MLKLLMCCNTHFDFSIIVLKSFLYLNVIVIVLINNINVMPPIIAKHDTYIDFILAKSLVFIPLKMQIIRPKIQMINKKCFSIIFCSPLNWILLIESTFCLKTKTKTLFIILFSFNFKLKVNICLSMMKMKRSKIWKMQK